MVVDIRKITTGSIWKYKVLVSILISLLYGLLFSFCQLILFFTLNRLLNHAVQYGVGQSENTVIGHNTQGRRIVSNSCSNKL